jgi:hypothetical protein
MNMSVATILYVILNLDESYNFFNLDHNGVSDLKNGGLCLLWQSVELDLERLPEHHK